MVKQTLKDADVEGKRVLVRVDFNVPLDDEGRVTDDRRIRESLPTIENLLARGAKVILVSHLGRPKGVTEKLRMDAVAERLETLTGRNVLKTNNCIGPEVKAIIDQTNRNRLLLLENIRFYKEEEANDSHFAKELSELADIYVNDAFGTAHRAHASTAGIAKYLPAYAGLLLEKEVNVLTNILTIPKKPFVAIIGGSKITDKIGVIKNLLNKVDAVLIGGGIACTFLKAQGYEVGKSLVESDKIEVARTILQEAERIGSKLYLPEDVVVAGESSANAKPESVLASKVPNDKMILDIGPKTAQHYGELVKKSNTAFWNGPMGVFELSSFANGTKTIAEAFSSCKGTTVIGGGDTASAVEKFGLAKKVTHISTGGGATLEFLAGLELPGISAIPDKKP